MATLSSMICLMMLSGLAPMARRTPISWVRSRTETNMMLLTPTMPESMVSRPMIHTANTSPFMAAEVVK